MASAHRIAKVNGRPPKSKFGEHRNEREKQRSIYLKKNRNKRT